MAVGVCAIDKFFVADRDMTENSKEKFRGLAHGEILLAGGMTVNIPASERFRMIRAKIDRYNVAHNNSLRFITVTSAVAQEGKSVVAVNLARALSFDPRGRTLIIDCDLRRPTVHKFFGLPLEPGLSNYIYEQRPLSEVIRNVHTRTDVISAGSLLSDPAQAVERPELLSLFNEVRKTYQYVIIDCPPVLLCPEPISLSLLSDKTLLVARAWKTERSLVADAVETIGKSRIFGVVMNDAEDTAKEYLDYGYYSSHQPQSNAVKKRKL